MKRKTYRNEPGIVAFRSQCCLIDPEVPPVPSEKGAAIMNVRCLVDMRHDEIIELEFQSEAMNSPLEKGCIPVILHHQKQILVYDPVWIANIAPRKYTPCDPLSPSNHYFLLVVAKKLIIKEMLTTLPYTVASLSYNSASGLPLLQQRHQSPAVRESRSELSEPLRRVAWQHLILVLASMLPEP